MEQTISTSLCMVSGPGPLPLLRNLTNLLGNLRKLTRRPIGGGHIQISIQLMSGAE